MPRRGVKCFAVSRRPPHLDDLHAHDDQRAGPSDRLGHRLVEALMSSAGPASVPTVWPGDTYPLGATYDGAGTNFSLFSEVAERVELCLIAKGGGEERINLDEVDGYVWHCYLPTVTPGQRYGFRVYGPWDPANGHRCDPSKLLLDPYGKSFHGDFEFTQALYSYNLEAAKADPADTANPPGVDSLGHTMTSVVINPYFDWASDRAPRTPYH